MDEEMHQDFCDSGSEQQVKSYVEVQSLVKSIDS